MWSAQINWQDNRLLIKGLRFAFFGLVIINVFSSVSATEQVALPPSDDGRRANEAALISSLKPVNCVSSTQTQASTKCPVACQINVPISELAQGDSCAPQTWKCEWPKQAVSITEGCPAGWIGSITKDEIFEIRNCGTSLFDTGKSTVTSSGCTRTRLETRTEACPSGGDWSGAGVTKVRNVYENLNKDLTTVSEVSSSAWVVNNVQCNRTINKETYTICPLPSVNTCTRIISQVNGNLISATCPGTNPPANSNGTVTAVTQHLSKDTVTPIDDASGSPRTTVTSCYMPCNLPWGGTISEGQSVTAYSYGSLPPGGNCSNYRQTRTCTHGTLSGSYPYSSCQQRSWRIMCVSDAGKPNWLYPQMYGSQIAAVQHAPAGQSTWVVTLDVNGNVYEKLNCYDYINSYGGEALFNTLNFSAGKFYRSSTCARYAPGPDAYLGDGAYLAYCTYFTN